MPKSGVLPLGSPSFSLDHMKEKDLAEDFGSGMMYKTVAPHAWSPLNIPHSDKETKAKANQLNQKGASFLIRPASFFREEAMSSNLPPTRSHAPAEPILAAFVANKTAFLAPSLSCAA